MHRYLNLCTIRIARQEPAAYIKVQTPKACSFLTMEVCVRDKKSHGFIVNRTNMSRRILFRAFKHVERFYLIKIFSC